MKGREFERLAKSELLPWLPGWSVKGRLLFATPIRGVLCGAIWNQSGFSRYVAKVELFIQPLYVPAEHLVLSDSLRDEAGYQRLRGDWQIDPRQPGSEIDRLRDALFAAVPGSFDTVASETGYARYLHQHNRELAGRRWIDPNIALKWGATLVLLGRSADAMDVLAAGVRSGQEPDLPDWVHVIARRCADLFALTESDPGAAITQLVQWRGETLQALGLSRWADEQWPERCA